MKSLTTPYTCTESFNGLRRRHTPMRCFARLRSCSRVASALADRVWQSAIDVYVYAAEHGRGQKSENVSFSASECALPGTRRKRSVHRAKELRTRCAAPKGGWIAFTPNHPPTLNGSQRFGLAVSAFLGPMPDLVHSTRAMRVHALSVASAWGQRKCLQSAVVPLQPTPLQTSGTRRVSSITARTARPDGHRR